MAQGSRRGRRVLGGLGGERMTVPDFVAWAQGYYGPYPVGQRADVSEYLRELGPDELDELKIQMRVACPSHIGQVNGYPPDIEGMSKIVPEVRRVVAHRERQRICDEQASRMLPAPEGETPEDKIKLDWLAVFREGHRRAEELRLEREAREVAQ
jgi:hypothetical protein